jgi:transcriptional regulator with XRE-family HTH domain
MTVRGLRNRGRVSLRQLAAKVGFSPSFLSQVENNLVSPSISSLERLATGLGVSLAELFQPYTPPGVTSRRGRPRLTSGWSRARLEPLGPAGEPRRLEAMLVTIRAGGASGKRPHAYHRERFAMVFEGTIVLTLGEEHRVLRRGDTATIDPEMPHRWQNRGRRPASLVIVTARP